MNKTLLTVFALLCIANANGQGVTVQNQNPTSSIANKGSYIADSIVRTGVRGSLTKPSWWNPSWNFNGAMQIDSASGNFYWYSNNAWKTFVGGSADSVTFYTNYRADTSIAKIYAAIAASGGATDSTIFVTQSRLDDTAAAIRGDFPSAGVPYVGATANVDLGVYDLDADVVNANQSVVDMSSGAGVALTVIKGGAGEALNVTKISGIGNAASITGGTTLIETLNLTNKLADTYISSATAWNAKLGYSDTGRGVAQIATGGSLNKVRDSLQANIDLKQNNITLTTVGTSGASTLVGSTLNIPNYAGGGGTIYDSVVMATVYGVDTGKARLTASISTKQPQLSGTGFVKATGTTISYDNSTYLTTATAASTYLPKVSPTSTGTSTNDYVNANQYYSTPQTLSDGATTTWNANLGCEAIWTIGGVGRTLTITNPIAGAFYTLKIIQGTGGSKTITTYPTNTKWSGGTAPTLTTAAASVDIISFWYDGTNYNAMYSLDVK